MAHEKDQKIDKIAGVPAKTWETGLAGAGDRVAAALQDDEAALAEAREESEAFVAHIQETIAKAENERQRRISKQLPLPSQSPQEAPEMWTEDILRSALGVDGRAFDGAALSESDKRPELYPLMLALADSWRGPEAFGWRQKTKRAETADKVAFTRSTAVAQARLSAGEQEMADLLSGALSERQERSAELWPAWPQALLEHVGLNADQLDDVLFAVGSILWLAAEPAAADKKAGGAWDEVTEAIAREAGCEKESLRTLARLVSDDRRPTMAWRVKANLAGASWRERLCQQAAAGAESPARAAIRADAARAQEEGWARVTEGWNKEYLRGDEEIARGRLTAGRWPASEMLRVPRRALPASTASAANGALRGVLTAASNQQGLSENVWRWAAAQALHRARLLALEGGAPAAGALDWLTQKRREKWLAGESAEQTAQRAEREKAQALRDAFSDAGRGPLGQARWIHENLLEPTARALGLPGAQALIERIDRRWEARALRAAQAAADGLGTPGEVEGRPALLFAEGGVALALGEDGAWRLDALKEVREGAGAVPAQGVLAADRRAAEPGARGRHGGVGWGRAGAIGASESWVSQWASHIQSDGEAPVQGVSDRWPAMGQSLWAEWAARSEGPRAAERALTAARLLCAQEAEELEASRAVQAGEHQGGFANPSWQFIAPEALARRRKALDETVGLIFAGTRPRLADDQIRNAHRAQLSLSWSNRRSGASAAAFLSLDFPRALREGVERKKEESRAFFAALGKPDATALMERLARERLGERDAQTLLRAANNAEAIERLLEERPGFHRFCLAAGQALGLEDDLRLPGRLKTALEDPATGFGLEEGGWKALGKLGETQLRLIAEALQGVRLANLGANAAEGQGGQEPPRRGEEEAWSDAREALRLASRAASGASRAGVSAAAVFEALLPGEPDAQRAGQDADEQGGGYRREAFADLGASGARRKIHKAFGRLIVVASDPMPERSVRGAREAAHYIAECEAREKRQPEMWRAIAEWLPRAGGAEQAQGALSDLADFFEKSEIGVWQALPERFGATALFRRVEAWHALLAQEQDAKALERVRKTLEAGLPKAREQGDVADEAAAREEMEKGAWPMALAGHKGEGETEAWSAVGLRTAGALFEEGKAMHHCVSSYAEACAGGGSRIYSIRNGGAREGTLELKALFKGGRFERWEVEQFRGVCNAQIKTRGAQSFAKEVAEKATEASLRNIERLRETAEAEAKARAARAESQTGEAIAENAAAPAREENAQGLRGIGHVREALDEARERRAAPAGPARPRP
jgi:hypothetical protein